MGAEVWEPTPRDIRTYTDKEDFLSAEELMTQVAQLSTGEYSDMNQEAARLFLQSEVDFLTGFRDAHVIPDYGHPDKVVLVGQWKHHPERGLVVRAGIDTCLSVALHRQPFSSGSYNDLWFIDARIDVEPHGGFLRIPAPNHGLSLHELSQIQELGNQFIGALRGYREVAKSRVPVIS